MPSHVNPFRSFLRRFGSGGAIVLSFVVAFEILIMISPFALLFYSFFNPVLLALNSSPLTRWLTAFFLPHMTVPHDRFLIILRILGSVLLIGGTTGFIVCAAQIYLGRIFSPGIATLGLYGILRHPQYTSLALAAMGLAIMWPRFLTLVLFGVMLFLYYVLSRDEERRMAAQYGEAYVAYRNRTGMFLPRPVESIFVQVGGYKGNTPYFRIVAGFAFLCVVFVSIGFTLRGYTIRSLPMVRVDSVDVVCISPVDASIAATLLPAILADSAVRTRMPKPGDDPNRRVLAYFLPVDFVMQGMIANTGDEWKLYEQHATIKMIVDYIMHPFSHLTRGHAEHQGGTMRPREMYAMNAMKRRVIFVEIQGDGRPLASKEDDFRINDSREPLFFVDVHLHTADILQVQDTPSGTGWGAVPTPMF